MNVCAENMQKTQVEDEKEKKVKLVIWDLDNTLWEGI